MSTATLQHPAPAAADDFDPRAEGQRLIKEWYAQLETANARNAAVANVFVMGNAVEILRAFDFELVFPEINSLQTGVRKASEEYIRLSEDYGMSPDVCSYVKADVGLILKENEHPAGRIPKASLAVASNMCGTFIKWAEIWERWLKTPTFVLDLPGQRAAGWQVRPGDAQHAADARWVEAQFKELIAQCERITGKRFDMDKLAEVEARVNKMVDHWNNVMALNRQCPAPFNAMLDGLTYIGIMNVHRGTEEGVEFMRRLEEHLKAKGGRDSEARGAGHIERERRGGGLRCRKPFEMPRQRIARCIHEQRKAKPDGAKRSARDNSHGKCGQTKKIEACARVREDFSHGALDRRMVDEVLHSAPRWLISR